MLRQLVGHWRAIRSARHSNFNGKTRLDTMPSAQHELHLIQRFSRPISSHLLQITSTTQDVHKTVEEHADLHPPGPTGKMME